MFKLFSYVCALGLGIEFDILINFSESVQNCTNQNYI